jgi:sirohydrochlorin ferrochelatase
LPRGDGGSVALVGAGSSRPEAAAELAAMGDLLGRRLATQVRVLSLAEDVRAGLERLPAPVRVATYLLAEGQFVTSLRAAADGIASVGEPLGVHPSLVELVWRRYDEALETHRVDSPATPAR